jgi:hypothetical protein
LTAISAAVELKSNQTDLNQKMAKNISGNTQAGLFVRMWHFIKLAWIGLKWNFLELFTPHRKFNLQSKLNSRNSNMDFYAA